MAKTPHAWAKSKLGHGNLLCSYCHATDLEISIIGDPEHCPEREGHDKTTKVALGPRKPPEPVARPNASWRDEYAEWHEWFTAKEGRPLQLQLLQAENSRLRTALHETGKQQIWIDGYAAAVESAKSCQVIVGGVCVDPTAKDIVATLEAGLANIIAGDAHR